MNHSVNNKRNVARLEREKLRMDAGLLQANFPGVEGIVIRMAYKERGARKSLSRLINFFPDSYAFFRIDCLNKECTTGGFDLSEIINGMIRNRANSESGNLNCEGDSPSAEHSSISYEISIQYS